MIGLRSCGCVREGAPHITSGGETHLVTEAAHASADGLLDDLKGPNTAFMDGGHGSEVVCRTQRARPRCWIGWGRDAIHGEGRRWRWHRMSPFLL